MKLKSIMIMAGVMICAWLASREIHRLWLEAKTAPTPPATESSEPPRIPLTDTQKMAREQILLEYGAQHLPAVFEAIQQLRAWETDSERQILTFKNSLQELGVDPNANPDYLACIRHRQWLLARRSDMEDQLEQLYVIWSKYLNMPDSPQ